MEKSQIFDKNRGVTPRHPGHPWKSSQLSFHPSHPIHPSYPSNPSYLSYLISLTTAWLARMGERRSAECKVAGLYPGRTNTQGL